MKHSIFCFFFRELKRAFREHKTSAFWILEIIAVDHVSSAVFCDVNTCALVERIGLS